MKTILIIDDDPDIGEALKLVFEAENFYAQVTANTANIHRDVNKFHPDIILLDVLLSGKDGREICAELKRNPKTKHIPIVMISAHPSAATNAFQYGADAFLPKPFDSNELVDVVRRYTEEIKNSAPIS